MRKEHTFKLTALAIIIVTLQACGGGSSNDSSPTLTPPAPITPTQPEGVIEINETTLVNQPAELFLYYPNDIVTEINWQQVAGSAATFLANDSKGIAFTPTVSGSYTFQVDFSRNGNAEQLSYSVDVVDGTSQISARLGHAVLEGNKVSLRANLDNSNLSVSSIRWEQNSGPSIVYDDTTDGSAAIFFTAPSVANDTLIEFTVSASDGTTTYKDNVAVLVEQAPDLNTHDNSAFDTRIANVFSYNPNSPYAETLQKCVYQNDIDYRQTCRFNELPLIAQDTTTPSVDDIMDHVVVSHAWMGDRFREFLINSDPHNDFKNLLRATTAVVISYDIRPSFYSVATGAIYLDPNYLWLTPDERDTINQAPDFRTSFGDQLSFSIPWRYVKDNNYASFFYPEEMRLTRQASDGLYSLAALMYHELAHANDFFPQSLWASFDMDDRIFDVANDVFQDSGIQSDKLIESLPLNGNEMFRLARVRFHGDAPTQTEQNYSPSDVTSFFRPELAPDFYNYSSTREDYAMLFDGFMMKARYDIDRDVAITNQPQSANDEYIVNWGQRGRIGDDSIKPRVSFVTARILPEFIDANNVINNLVAPIQMVSGNTWGENLAISPITTNDTLKQTDVLFTQPLDTVPFNQNIIPQDGELFFEKTLPFTKKQ